MNTHNSFETVPLRRPIEKTTNGTTATQVEEDYTTHRVTRIETISTGAVDLEKVGFVGSAENLRQFALKEGDILFSHINSMSVIGNSAQVPKAVLPLYVGMNLLRIRPSASTDPAFLAWCLKSDFIRHQVRQFAKPAINQASISSANLKRVRAPLPDLATQRKIADFLDRETARIDLLIEKKQRLVALLGEKKSATITNAVTGGSDKRAISGDGRVGAEGSRFARPAWASVLPSEWQVMPIKKIVVTPITDGPHETPEFLDEGVVFISAEAIQDGKIDFDRRRGFISEADNQRYSRKYSPKTGDIYVVKSGATTGKSAMVGDNVDFNIWSPLAVIRSKQTMESRFVLYTIRSQIVQDAIAVNWSWGTQQNIGMGALGRIQVPVPDIAIQSKIADFLDRETQKIDVIQERTNTCIDRLKEYRSALITAAVTGQIDVTTYAKFGTPDHRLEDIQEEMGA